MPSARPSTAKSTDTGQPLANARHERFAQLVVSGLPQSRAYIEAGYHGSESAARANAARLIATDSVASRVAELRAPAVAIAQAHAEEAIGSAAWIVEKAAEVVNRALAAVPVRNAKGEIVEGEWTCNLGAATPALALLAKMHPEFSEKHEVTGDVRLRVEALNAVAHLTPDELKALAARARS